MISCMAEAAKDLPENIDALKALIVVNEQMLLEKEQRIAVLEEQLRLLMHKRFGASSERASDDQLGLFNEAEATAETPAGDDTETTVPEHKRKKPGRRPLPADLPRIVIEHDLPEDQKVCPCGRCKKRIGQEISEQLDIIPPKAQVLQNVRYKYACPDCEGVEDDGPGIIQAMVRTGVGSQLPFSHHKEAHTGITSSYRIPTWCQPRVELDDR